MIHTLSYLQQEATLIAGYWDGRDERFIDGNGTARSDEDAVMARDLLEKIKEIEAMVKTLGI